MADTYKIGDPYKTTYPDAPVSKERQYRIGRLAFIREDGLLVAIYKVTATDDTNIEGEIVNVFKAKAPTDPQSTDPRKGGPTKNREVKPL